MGRKQPVDDLTALREATTEAHHAVQSLKDAAKEARDAKAELVAAKDDIIDMAKAMWDARLEELAKEALEKFDESAIAGVDRLLNETAARFSDVLLVVLGEKEVGEVKPETLVEQMVVERVEKFGPWHVHP